MRSLLAAASDRNDETLNEQLAIKIAANQDVEAVSQLIDVLGDGTRAEQGDAIKALYEIAERAPHLVSPYADTFVQLLSNRNNRLVWGSMHALALISPLVAADLQPRVPELMQTVSSGSVITQDWGVRLLTTLAAASPGENVETRQYLLQLLQTCRPKDLPRHAESAAPAFIGGEADRDRLTNLLSRRLPELSPAQSIRVQKLLSSIKASQQ